MKNRLIIILSFLVAFVTAFSGCSNECGTKKPNDSQNTVINETIDNSENHYQKITETDKYLVRNGRTDYYIVYPEDLDKATSDGVSELKYFFKKATGAELRSTSDVGMTHDDDRKVFSIGRTKLFETSGLTVDESKLGNDGHIIKTVGNTIYMIGGGYSGNLYAVYTFLERAFNFDTYTITTYTIDKVDTYKLYNYDIVEIPDIVNRRADVGYGCSTERLKKGLKYLGESIGYLPPTMEYQYGPARAGTAYPLCLIKGIQPPDYNNAYFGNKIWSPLFGQFESGLTLGFGDNGFPYAKREKGELKMLKQSIVLLDKGIKELEKVVEGDVSALINHAKYLKCCNVTMLNAAEFYHEKVMLRTYRTDEELKRITSRIRAIAANEIENAEESIAYLEKDSTLGFEPTMLYVNSPERVWWKIEQVRYMLDKELTYYEQD